MTPDRDTGAFDREVMSHNLQQLLAANLELHQRAERAEAERDKRTEALEAFANPQHWSIRRGADGHPDAVWIGTYQQSPVEFARAALAAGGEQQ